MRGRGGGEGAVEGTVDGRESREGISHSYVSGSGQGIPGGGMQAGLAQS